MLMPTLMPIIVFERHWDETPKRLLMNLLPPLPEKGYKTLCLEVPEQLTLSQIEKQQNTRLGCILDIDRQAKQWLNRAKGNPTCKLSDMSYDALAELIRQHVSSKKYNEFALMLKD